MKKILITGGNGYIASLVKEVIKDTYEVITLTRKELDLCDLDAVASYFKENEYAYVFHTGAMAQTADCENFPELTHRINVESTEIITNACKAKNARLIFISTEQCFNGKQVAGPFCEEDSLAPITTYAKHKQACETYIQANLTNYVILRFSWMFGLDRPGVKASPNIIKNVMRACLHQQPTKFTLNEIRGMTYAQLFANQFEKVMELPVGIYHVSDENTHSTYESAKIVARKLGYDEDQINTIILPDHERYQDRFRDYRLNNKKLTSAGITFGSFEDNVDACLSDFGCLAQ